MEQKKHVLHAGAHCRHLANTIEQSGCGTAAAMRAFCQITLTTFYYYREFIHVWNEPSCLYSPAAEHHRTLVANHFPSRVE